MVKYIIEGGDFNFYEELYESIGVDNADDTNDNLCLITNTPLTEYSVKLECGHNFNYLPLFNDLANHKKNYNSMERLMLKAMEIRCPYCRNVQKNLLPYHPELGLEKVHGVNDYDETKVLASFSNYSSKWSLGVCCFEIYDEEKNTYCPCNNKQVALIESIGKKYCSQHIYLAKKKFLFECKEKQKLEKMNLKMKLKAEKDLAKANEKKQKLEDKIKKQGEKANKNSKSNNSTVFDETVIITSADLSLCKQVL